MGHDEGGSGRLPVKPVTPHPSKPPVPEPARDKVRVGFLAGQADIPDDFDGMAADEIRALFEGDAPSAPQG